MICVCVLYRNRPHGRCCELCFPSRLIRPCQPITIWISQETFRSSTGTDITLWFWISESSYILFMVAQLCLFPASCTVASVWRRWALLSMRETRKTDKTTYTAWRPTSTTMTVRQTYNMQGSICILMRNQDGNATCLLIFLPSYTQLDWVYTANLVLALKTFVFPQETLLMFTKCCDSQRNFALASKTFPQKLCVCLHNPCVSLRNLVLSRKTFAFYQNTLCSLALKETLHFLAMNSKVLCECERERQSIEIYFLYIFFLFLKFIFPLPCPFRIKKSQLIKS